MALLQASSQCPEELLKPSTCSSCRQWHNTKYSLLYIDLDSTANFADGLEDNTSTWSVSNEFLSCNDNVCENHFLKNLSEEPILNSEGLEDNMSALTLSIDHDEEQSVTNTDELHEEYMSAMSLLENTIDNKRDVRSNSDGSFNSSECHDCLSSPELFPDHEGDHLHTTSSSSFNFQFQPNAPSSDCVNSSSRNSFRKASSISDSCYSSDNGVPDTHSTSALSSLSSTLDNSNELSIYSTPIVQYQIFDASMKFTLYKIKVKSSDGFCEWFVYRRYSDFARLNKQLHATFSSISLTLPPARWVKGNFKPEFLQERLSGLQVFLNNIAVHNALRQHSAVAEFLCLPGKSSSLPYCSCGSRHCPLSRLPDGTQESPVGGVDAGTELVMLRTELNSLRLRNSALRDALKSECEMLEQSDWKYSPVHKKNKFLLLQS